MFARLGAIYFLTVLVLSLGGIAAWQHNYIAELSGAMGAAEAEIDTLKADVDKMKQQLATERLAQDAAHYRFQVEKDEAAKAIASLKGQLGSVEGDLADVRSKLTAEQETSAAAKRLSERNAAELAAAEKAAAARAALEARQAAAAEAKKSAGQQQDGPGAKPDREAALGSPATPGVAEGADKGATAKPSEQKPTEQKPAEQKSGEKNEAAADPATPAAADRAVPPAGKVPEAKPTEAKPKKSAKRRKKPAADSYFSF